MMQGEHSVKGDISVEEIMAERNWWQQGFLKEGQKFGFGHAELVLLWRLLLTFSFHFCGTGWN